MRGRGLDIDGTGSTGRRLTPIVFGTAMLCLPLACSQTGDTSTVVPGSASADEAATTTTGGLVMEDDLLRNPYVTTPSPSTIARDTATSTVPAENAVTTTEPDSSTGDPVNVYALAGARAVAERANRTGLDGLDPDGVAEVLLEASEAAYDIEYPSIVMYLDVSQDDDMNLIVVTEDESQTIVGTAYVCVVDGTAVAQEDACVPTSQS
jgi:hypothetical protein